MPDIASLQEAPEPDSGPRSSRVAGPSSSPTPTPKQDRLPDSYYPSLRTTIDLSGAGRNFLWSTSSTLATLAGTAALVAYNVRVLGPAQYGSVATIGAWLSILAASVAALNYSVVRSAASLVTDDQGGLQTQSRQEAIAGSHSLFLAGALLLTVGCAALGWLVPVDLGLHGEAAFRVYIATVLFGLATALPVTTTAFSGILTSHECFGLLAKVSLATFVLQAVLTVALVHKLQIIALGVAAVAAAMLKTALTYYFARKHAHWLSFRPHLVPRSSLIPVLRYSGGIAVLWLTATLESSSDAFVIGAIRGGTAVTTFRIGSLVPTNLAPLLMTGFAVLFPRLARSRSLTEQEDAIAWTGRVIGWVAGVGFASLSLLGGDIVRVFLGHPSNQARLVLLLCAAALCLDTCYHGVVQVVLARGQQAVMARVSWLELVVNLAVTVLAVTFFGPVGSALALATTIAVMDLLVFPLIMRGHWCQPAGRFVWRNGVAQAFTAVALAMPLALLPLPGQSALVTHAAWVALDATAVLTVGYLALGRLGRSRLLALFGKTSLT